MERASIPEKESERGEEEKKRKYVQL